MEAAFLPVQPPLFLIHRVPLPLPALCQMPVKAHDPHLSDAAEIREQIPYIVPHPFLLRQRRLHTIAFLLQHPIRQEELGDAGHCHHRQQRMVGPQRNQQRQDASHGGGQHDGQHEDSRDAVILHAFLRPLSTGKHPLILVLNQRKPR